MNRWACQRLVLAGFGLLVLAVPARAADLVVRTDFPGGSARVEAIDQQTRTIRLFPTRHPDRGWVCWWYCKVEGITPGETLTLQVGGGSFALPTQAAYSLDNREWKQTEPGTKANDVMVYRQQIDAPAVWFAWGPPFVLTDARRLIERVVAASPGDRQAIELCQSAEGRSVPGVRFQTAGANRVIWVNARQHAWESGGSWVAAGLIEWLASDDPRAAALKKQAVITVIPIMDLDNVERGAGGKEQKPQDHNRDWSDNPHWPEVRAAQQQIKAADADGRFDLFIDLHNPGPGDRQPFFFVPPRADMPAVSRQNLDSFLEAARAEITGPLKLAATPRESGPNYDKNWRNISKNWVAAHTRPHVVAVTLETAWNNPASNQDGYRTVGRQLGLAIERYLRQGATP